ncbi:hypothetical protein [uncultured Roseovarius sp.]|uniref:hypothetical protein n=1 Tax=uncultured Roseovarius sp. TaxID=293344 RepID=UPI002615D46A|nr:hypothetical protein [uncultured Roseovarius sp.]
MTIGKLTTVLCAALIAAPAFAGEESVLPASGDEIEKYRNAGDWTIYKNMTQQSCFTVKAGETTAVQLGLTKDKQFGYIGVFMKGADVAEENQAVAVAVNDNIYVGEAGSATHLTDDYKGGYVLANDKQLRLDLEKAAELIAFPESANVVTVDLKGSGNAIYEARKCNDEMQGG